MLNPATSLAYEPPTELTNSTVGLKIASVGGLLEYYSENAQDVAQAVYDNREVRMFIDGKGIKAVTKNLDLSLGCPPLSEEDKQDRILRVEVMIPLVPDVLKELMDELSKR